MKKTNDPILDKDKAIKEDLWLLCTELLAENQGLREELRLKLQMLKTMKKPFEHFEVKPKTTKTGLKKYQQTTSGLTTKTDWEKLLDSLLDQVEQLASGLAKIGGDYPHPKEQIKSLFKRVVMETEVSVGLSNFGVYMEEKEKALSHQRQEILDQVEKEVIGEDEHYPEGQWKPYPLQVVNQLRAEQRQKLSALRGGKK